MTLRSAIALGLLLGLTSLTGAQEARRYALLVGVAEYGSPDLEDLRFTENDVEKLALVLQRPPKPYTRVVVMTPTRGQKDPDLLPTAANISRQLDRLAGRCEKDDLLFVALTGHGLEPRGGKAFFCGYQARLEDPKTMLPLDEVYRTLEDSDAGMKLLVVDACRNDPGGKGIKLAVRDEKNYQQLTTGERPPARAVALFSCSPGERSWESEQLQHGVFFSYLIQGLSGAAARPNEETVGWASLAGYVQDGVDQESKKQRRTQRPHFKGDINTSIPLVVLPPGASSLVETFRNVKPGEVPKGWDRDDAIGVRLYQGLPCLEADMKGGHSVTTPKLRIEGDFIVDVVFEFGYNNGLTVTLEGKDGGPSLPLVLTPPYSGHNGVELGPVKASERITHLPETGRPKPRLRLEREGDIIRLIDNGRTLIARPFRDFKDFDRVKLTLTGEEPNGWKARVYAIGVSPRPSGEKKP